MPDLRTQYFHVICATCDRGGESLEVTRSGEKWVKPPVGWLVWQSTKPDEQVEQYVCSVDCADKDLASH